MTGSSASLNATRRAAELERLAEGDPIDLVVIGGGITGAGVALDAASRGLRVALLERRDLAHGTSRWSSKLVHGGLRYLRQAELRVARESARERHILLTTTAPHLVRPLAFVVPLNRALGKFGGLLTEAGVRTGDLLRVTAGTRRDRLPPPRRISPHEAAALVPGLRRADLRGALLFWDCQVVDDARLVVNVARTAASYGASVITYCGVVAVRNGEVDAVDERTSRMVTIRTRAVVNATGVWAGALDPAIRLRPSKGAHVILRAETLGAPRAAVITPVLGGTARWIGATPTSDGRVIVGVTDDPFEGPIPDEPTVSASDERFLLDTLSQVTDSPIDADAVVGRYAGLRPLLDGGRGTTSDISRRHALVDNPDLKMVSIVGGKLTTYRAMAEDAVDRVCRLIGVDRKCRTDRLALVGAGSRSELDACAAPRRLVERYGLEAAAMVERSAGMPSLLQPLAEGVGALGVEVAFAVEHEGALSLDDVLDRRIRLGLVPEDRRRSEGAAADVFGQVAR